MFAIPLDSQISYRNSVFLLPNKWSIIKIYHLLILFRIEDLMLTPYSSPVASCRTQMEIKKSLFIADIIPVHTTDDVESALAAIKKEFKDATHHCYAYRLGTTQIAEKSSDGGEPSGTAGHPMLHVLQGNELTNVLGIVTRYFGGIKLGAGGLARAYAGSLADTVKAAPLARYTPHNRMELTIPYSAVGSFEHYVEGTDIRVLDRAFSDKVKISFLCLPEKAEEHARVFTDMTAGKAQIEKIGEEYVPIRK